MDIIDISTLNVLMCYTLLIIPLSIILWYRIPIVKSIFIAMLRMTIQLLFVGLYLQVVFELNSFWLTAAWLLIMIVVADVSIARGCRLRISRFGTPLFLSLFAGTTVPMIFLVGVILHRPHLLDAQYAIPIGGMILGNCLRSNIIGIKTFYESIRTNEKQYIYMLSQGASLSEATRSFLQGAYEAALAPTIATIATIGLVALPGMMTGVILGGANPMTAIKYQIAIMIAIFTGTVITVALAIRLTTNSSFNSFGILDKSIFK